MSLDEYLAAETRKPFAWAETDCAATADRWVQVAAGKSFLAASGIHYRDETEARAIMAKAPLHLVINRAMRAAGFRPTKNPEPGDVGLVFHAGRLCVAIWTGRLWFARDADGMIGASASACWKAWSISRAQEAA